MRPKLAICASGSGNNFENLVHASRQGLLEADVVGLVTNREGIPVLARAQRLGIPFAVLVPKNFPNRVAWDHAFFKQLQAWEVEWVALAGFLALIGPEVLNGYPRRMVNSHPALLPKHGGPGMYGDQVHASVLKSGDQETGVTIHWVDAHYDHGSVIAQQKVPIHSTDTVETLAARVKQAELKFYPTVLNDLLTGRLTIS